MPKPAGHAHDDRRGEAIGGAPTHRTAVVELLGGGVGVLAELNLSDRHESRDRHADRTADDAFFGEARVEDARFTELFLKAFGDQVHAALAADVLAEHETLGIDLELASECATHGLGESHDVGRRRRSRGAAERGALAPRQPAERFRRARQVVGVNPSGDRGGVGVRPCAGRVEAARYVVSNLLIQLIPFRAREERRDEVRLETWQRIACLVGRDLGVGAIASLIVGPGVARETRHGEPHECRPLASAGVLHAIGDAARGVGGVGPVAVAQIKILERREVARDVGARRLQIAAHRDAEPVVLDVEDHRQRQRRRHGERRPETVRRDRRFAAEHDADRAVPRRVAQFRRVISNRLRPAGARRVLRADVAGHRQHHRPVAVRQIAHDADVPSVAEAARSAERARERILDRQAEGEQQRSRTIVRARRVVAVIDERTENRLRDVVAARRELVEDEVLAWNGRAILVRRLLDVVERARDEGGVRDAAPIEAWIGRAGGGGGRAPSARRGMRGGAAGHRHCSHVT